MCEPVSMSATALATAKLGIAAASAAATVATSVSAYQQQAEMKAQSDQAAKDAYILQTHLVGRQQQQIRDASSQKQQDNSVKSLQAQATGLVASAGVEGRSVEGLLQDFQRNEGVISDRLDQSLENKQEQSRYDLLGLQANAQNRINSTPEADISTVYSNTIRGAGSVLDEYGEFSNLMGDG